MEIRNGNHGFTKIKWVFKANHKFINTKRTLLNKQDVYGQVEQDESQLITQEFTL
jgi:hypothetical protein